MGRSPCSDGRLQQVWSHLHVVPLYSCGMQTMLQVLSDSVKGTC